MPENTQHINYSFADISRYLNGGMTAKEMHDIERAALQDPFLADAIEGYREADTDVSKKHLNDITAALQKEQPASVVSMPKKRSYRWLVAASLLAVTGAGVFLFSSQNENPASLADNSLKSERQADTTFISSTPAMPQSDSQPPASAELNLTKPNEESRGRMAVLEKRKGASAKETTPAPAPQREEPESADVAKAYSIPQNDDKDITQQKSPAQVMMDSAPVAASMQVKKSLGYNQTKPSNPWTNDKGKPFLLSDVEVIHIGKKDAKKADTSSVKPDGGWQLFQDYLFSRLSRKDSLSFINNSVASNLELEFSIDESGSPYDIKVLHAQDSTVTHKIADAVQSGPKWTSDKKAKRLRLRY